MGAERRQAIRYPASRVSSCNIIRLPETEPMPAILKDISRSGIGLICPGDVEKGIFLAITLINAKSDSKTLRALVVHSAPIAKDQWMVGCVLSQQLSEAELEQFK